MVNNPYINQVKNHSKIIVDLEKIYSNKWKWSNFFDNKKPLILEIWTWLWNYFSSQVIDNPEKNYIGIEIRYKRLYKTAEKSWWKINNNDNDQIKTRSINLHENFIVLKDFWENIDKIFWENELDETYVFFPDPWDKNDKSRTRRMVQKKFLKDLYDITKSWWKFIFKTDHKWYFDFVLWELENTNWEIDYKTYDYENDWLYKQNKITEFEQIFRWQDLKVNYLVCKK